MRDSIIQTAPYPELLAQLVEQVRYKTGWTFELVDNFDRGQGSKGMTLVIGVTCTNSRTGTPFLVNHYMIVPAASFDMRSWRRWLFEQILLAERHEAAEFFCINNDRPYAPSHGPGNDPYVIRELGTEEDFITDQRGNVVRHTDA